MRRLHPSDAGTAGPMDIPPDPGEVHRYVEFPTLENQDEDANKMQQDDVPDTRPTPQEHPVEEYNIPWGHNKNTPASPQVSIDTENIMEDEEPTLPAKGTLDENGGIEDDDLLEVMANEVKAMHTTTPEASSPLGPTREPVPRC